MLNVIRDNLALMGWETVEHTVDFYAASSPTLVRTSLDISPESIDVLSTSMALEQREREFWLAARTALEPLHIWGTINKRRNEVAGSPEFFDVGDRKAASWTWKVKGVQVEYTHSNAMDMLDVTFVGN
jgi:hypothetical protein